MISKIPISFSIIIPNYNGAEFLLNCLQSLIQSIKKCPQLNFEIIIVDNGSIDNGPQLAKNFFSKHKLQNLTSNILHLNTNTGFAFAINQGINTSQYPYICVCNNDLKINSNWFKIISQNIISNQNNPKIVTYFGTVLNHNGSKFESQGFQFFYSGKAINISNGKKFNKKKFLTPEKLKSEKLIWGAPAAMIIYRKEIVQKIGMFDINFFAYEEDIDLSLRLHNFGYQTLYIPQAISYHLGGATSKKMGNFRHKMDVKNWFYVIIKNYSLKQIFINFFPIIEQRLRNLSALIKNTSIYQLPKDIIQIYGEILFNLPKMLQKRRHIQKMLKFHNS